MRPVTLITLIVLAVLIVVVAVAQLTQEPPATPYPGPVSGTPYPTATAAATATP